MSKASELEYVQSSESQEEERSRKRRNVKILRSMLVNQAAVRVKLKTPLQNVKSKNQVLHLKPN